MKSKKELIPKYTIIPLAILLLFHLAVFYVTRPITSGMTHHDLSTWIDLKIPFVPAFIVIYVLAYVQWAYGIYYLSTRGRDVAYKFLAATMIGEIMCFITFIAVPTELCGAVTQPEVTGGDVFSWMTRLIYSLDEPNNLFPSLHCFASWMCFRGIFYIEKEKRNKAYTVFSFVFSLLVFASTVLVKQHVFVDIIGGVAYIEIAILIEKLTGAHRVYYALEKRIFKNKTEGKES